MANLKEVRIRISSVISTQQITKAMKMVSASKLRKAQNAITQIRPYTTKLEEVIGNIQSSLENESESPLTQAREINKVLIVVVTSDKGLCGGFNANLIKLTKQLLTNKYAKQHANGNATLMTLGKKGMEHFSKQEGYKTDKRHYEIFNALSFETVSPIVEDITKQFLKGECDAVEVVYSRFKNAGTQIITNEQLLPIAAKIEPQTNNTKVDYLFEPTQAEIVDSLLPTYIKIQLYKCLLDNNASEHGARMTSMDKATENAGELLKALKLQYNRARQAAITTEISEIVGGAAALDN